MVVTTPIFLVLKVPFALLSLLIGAAELILYWGVPRNWYSDHFFVLFQNWWLAIQVAMAAIFMQTMCSLLD